MASFNHLDQLVQAPFHCVVKVELVEGSEEAQDVAFQNRKLSQKLHEMAQFGTFVLLVLKNVEGCKSKMY